MMEFPVGKSRTAIAIALLLAAHETADAAWELVPEFALTAEVDDNARILVEEQPSATRMALDARLLIRSFSERSEIFIEPRIVTDTYADSRDEEIANDDLFLRTRALREFRRSWFRFQSDFRRESVLRSEIEDVLAEPGEPGTEPVATGAGTFGTFTDERERFDLGLAGQIDLTDRTALGLGFDWMDVAYLDDFLVDRTERTDFTSRTLTTSLSRAVNDRDTVGATIYATHLNADRVANKSDTLGVTATFRRPLNPVLDMTLEAGIARIDFAVGDTAGVSRTGIDNAFTYGLEVRRRGEAATWTFGFSRSIRPSSQGLLAERDDVILNVGRQIGPRLELTGGLRAARLDESVSVGASSHRQYLRGAIALEWSLSERMQVGTGYDRVLEERDNGAREAVSNSVFVSLRYRGLSRE